MEFIGIEGSFPFRITSDLCSKIASQVLPVVGKSCGPPTVYCLLLEFADASDMLSMSLAKSAIFCNVRASELGRGWRGEGGRGGSKRRGEEGEASTKSCSSEEKEGARRIKKKDSNTPPYSPIFPIASFCFADTLNCSFPCASNVLLPALMLLE